VATSEGAGTAAATEPEATQPEAATSTTVATTEDGAVTSAAGTAPESTAGSVPGETETSAAGEAPLVTGSGTIGPTTSGPECQFAENDELPLERCDVGPAIRALQSVLQTLHYGNAVDCRFGDQTLYAVAAFQTDRDLTANGIVDEETWNALEELFLAGWGEDGNGNDVIDPNEITLECG
jgi:peptidoglycan hydrolase-like protein with peptidoglycan-binding domain